VMIFRHATVPHTPITCQCPSTLCLHTDISCLCMKLDNDEVFKQIYGSYVFRTSSMSDNAYKTVCVCPRKRGMTPTF
jgi:hypothetical protein